MFQIDSDLTIHLTRGDRATLQAGARDLSEEGRYTFRSGDVVRLTVCEKKDYSKVCFTCEVSPEVGAQVANLVIEPDMTRFGPIIHKPTDFYYEIELNPDTDPHTIIGHDKTGPKIFKLYPEGGERV